MKISKVDHRRTAVAVNKQTKTTGGILYNVPATSPKAMEATARVVEGAVQKSSRLYSPFTNRSIPCHKETGRQIKIVKACYGTFIKRYVGKRALNRDRQTFEPDKKYTSDSQIKIKGGIDDKAIDMLIEQALRKSLKRNITVKNQAGELISMDIPELIKKSIKIYCIRQPQELSSTEMFEMYTLFSCIFEDKYKEEQKGKIEKGISNQTAKVKVTDSGSGKLIKLSIADTKKKPVWDFMVAYADADKNSQNAMLHGIKKDIVLFVCGAEVYESIDDKDILDNSAQGIWSWDGYGIPGEQSFISDVSGDDKNENVSMKVISEANVKHYREAVKVSGDRDGFWFKHFEDALETLFSKKSKGTADRFKSDYLCDYLWKDFFSYIALKYVDLGKGVYHFTMLDKLSLADKGKWGDGLSFGEVSSRFNRGISSFDYERIKAEEALDRDISSYATFAANIFAKAAVQDDYRLRRNKQNKASNSDVLQYSQEAFSDGSIINEDAVKRILQYWGGQSRWQDEAENIDIAGLCYDIKERLSNIRNTSVHYTSKASLRGTDAESPTIKMLFEKDYNDLKNIYSAKYYSNNAWIFYKANDINLLMGYLYKDDSSVREAQIPSFNSVIKRKDMAEVVEKIIKKNSYKSIREPEQREQYRACLYFILKEIYYNAFIKQDNLKQQLVEFARNSRNFTGDNENAIKDFRRRLDSVTKAQSDMSFGELCQTIMTDYNMQNQGKHSKRSLDAQKKAKQNGYDNSYKHFPLLLHHVIKGLFLDFVNSNEKLAFISRPALTGKDISQEEFQSCIQPVSLYAVLKEAADSNGSLLDWYTLAHFLMPKQLNHLIGDIRNYIQYLGDIDKRAGSVGNNKAVDTKDKVSYYSNIVKILEFSQQYVGRVSNNISDYFSGEEEYAAFMSQFVEFQGIGMEKNPYCDEANPIMNRNIAYARMYSNDEILSRIYTKVTAKDVDKYYKSNAELKNVFENGVCKNADQQVALCNFQKLKNHIELTEISIYTDILNDFMSQFISWAYLRERDLMYFQLGLHYIRLFYNSEELDARYNELHGDGDKAKVKINRGALLYQIAAMYSHERPVYAVDDNNVAEKASKQGSAGASIKSFVNDYCKESLREARTYENGLELFETVKQHDELSSLRNDIAHMRYMSDRDRSIMDIVSDMYRSFFIYDTKLKKSVSFVFKNILMRYGVDAELEFTHSGGNKEINLIAVKDLRSDKYTYKVPGAQRGVVEIEVRGKQFLQQLNRLLMDKE